MTDSPIKSLGVKELKALIASADVSLHGVVDKEDLRERASIACERRGLTSYQETVCDLNLKFAGFPYRSFPDVVVVLLHGYGDDNTNFARGMDSSFPCEKRVGSQDVRISYVFPSMGSQWWPLSPSELSLVHAAADDDFRRGIERTPSGFSDARSKLVGLLDHFDEYYTKHCGSASFKPKIVLGGFSQGSILSSDVAYERMASERVHGLLAFSTIPVNYVEWLARIEEVAASGLKVHVLVTHGTLDPVIPPRGSALLATDVERIRSENPENQIFFVRHVFEGFHTLPVTVSHLYDDFLDGLLA